MTKQRRLAGIGTRVERIADVINSARRRAEVWRRGEAPLRVVSFGGFGTREAVSISGRVLREWPRQVVSPTHGRCRNLLANLRLLDSNEVPGVVVRITYCDRSTEVTTDEEGYFHARVGCASSEATIVSWQKVAIELVPGGGLSHGEVLVPSPTADFGIISDLDDTVVITEVRKPLRAVSNILLGNAYTRPVFAGTAVLYEALTAGSGDSARPIFYLSNSPWNLFETLNELLAVRGFPRGPILLRDYGFDATTFLKDDRHKSEQIRRILTTYPGLRFLLIGDSGEQDPQTYRQAIRDFPGRILGVVIRDVTRGLATVEVEKVAERSTSRVVEMAHVPDAASAATFAVSRGWITSTAGAEVEEASRAETRRSRGSIAT